MNASLWRQSRCQAGGTWLALQNHRKRDTKLKNTSLLGVALLVLGILAVAYGGFTYTKDTDNVDIGPIHFQVKDKERVNIPLWLGIGVAIVGGVLLARRPGKA